MQESIVIIGSGLAGYSLAKEFRQLDKETPLTLITADRGDFYSKPQLSTALTAKRDASALVMSTAARMADKLNLNVLTQTTVTAVDRDTKTVVFEQGSVHYSKLILALGADKLMAPLSGDGVEDVQSINTLEEYEIFREWLEGKKKIAIIGAGLVGCEFANDLINTGYEVEVIAPENYPLTRFVPEKVGKALQDALSKLGVCWNLCRFATEVNQSDTGYTLLLDNMDKVAADGVLSAIGLRARIQLASDIGLEVGRGIIVNRQLQTSDPDIYALGDCAEVNGHLLLHIAPLLMCARALAKILTGDDIEVRYPPMPVIVKTPACPINSILPEADSEGSWACTGDDAHLDCQFFDFKENLLGFTLTGKAMRRRAELIKELPDLF